MTVHSLEACGLERYSSRLRVFGSRTKMATIKRSKEE